jgi:hypothetical protein
MSRFGPSSKRKRVKSRAARSVQRARRMKPSHLFHTIVVVGAAMTAPAGLIVAAATLPACDGSPESFTLIDMPMAPLRDLAHAFPTIDLALAPIDLGTSD